MDYRTEAATNHENGLGGAFYQCENGAECGLRFPVNWNDHFADRCPRCHSPVRLVAQVEHPAETHPVRVAFPSAPGSRLRLLLDNWRSNFNVGAAFRTADGAGIEHIYLCGITPTPESQRKLAKTALGAEQYVPWSYHPNAVQLAAHLQEDGAELWVLERNTTSSALFDIMSLSVQRPVVLAAGNEVVGVDPALVAMADRVLSLPMMGSKESLNVAVALSVATYWLRARELANHDADPQGAFTDP
jgi:tRNA G18 (ribose-2'-O)-methylase SpoU